MSRASEMLQISAPQIGVNQLKHLRSARHRALISAIVEARRAAGLTQRQLAAKLKRSNSFVWKIEAGERRVDILDS
jgi:ribosome-binding protein aMBF1 (putative translation factor)